MTINNSIYGIVLLISGAAGFPVFLLSLKRKKKGRPLPSFFGPLCLSNALWSLFCALFFLLPGQTAFVFYILEFAAASVSGVATYMLMVKLLGRQDSLGAAALASAIPIVILALTIINRYYSYAAEGLSFGSINGLRAAAGPEGLWVLAHGAAFCVCLALASGLLIKQYLRLPKNHRSPVLPLMAGWILMGAARVLPAAGLNVVPFGLASAIAQVSQIILFAVLIKTRALDTLLTSRDLLFCNNKNAVFILDNDRKIVDCNSEAAHLGVDIGSVNLRGTAYSYVVEKLMEIYSGRFFQGDSSVFTLYKEDADVHYQVVSTDIPDGLGNVAGSYVEIANVTPFMSFIYQLRDIAYYDQLTGLHNRRSFVERLAEFDDASYMPLGVMVGDVNGLKKVNDTKGHALGDELLISISKVLISASKNEDAPDALWFRTGGDEFIGLFPNTTQKRMEDAANEISRGCSSLDSSRFLGADIAIAYRLKTQMWQDVQLLLEEADRSMYEDKYNRRKSG